LAGVVGDDAVVGVVDGADEVGAGVAPVVGEDFELVELLQLAAAIINNPLASPALTHNRQLPGTCLNTVRLRCSGWSAVAERGSPPPLSAASMPHR
jgi:hypothetical protein